MNWTELMTKLIWTEHTELKHKLTCLTHLSGLVITAGQPFSWHVKLANGELNIHIVEQLWNVDYRKCLIVVVDNGSCKHSHCGAAVECRLQEVFNSCGGQCFL